MIHKRSIALERSVKYFTRGLKPGLRRAKLTLSSGGSEKHNDQDRLSLNAG